MKIPRIWSLFLRDFHGWIREFSAPEGNGIEAVPGKRGGDFLGWGERENPVG